MMPPHMHPGISTILVERLNAWTCIHILPFVGKQQKMTTMSTERREPPENLLVRSSESMKLFPAGLALDSNPRSCFYSHRSPPKWIQIDFAGQKDEKTRRISTLTISLPVLQAAGPAAAGRREQDKRTSKSHSFFSSILRGSTRG
jgi:hypothetical protein